MKSSTTQPMEVDVLTSEFIEHCMGTPTVLRQVLEHFPNHDLLTLSLVNKQWNFEARSVLKSRGDLTARVCSYAGDPCRSLVAFALDLIDMRVVPFSGIHVHLSHDKDSGCQSWLNYSVGPSSKVILDRLPWTHLGITFKDTVYNCKECKALKFAKKMFEDLQQVLEELSLIFDWEEEKEKYQQIFQGCTFPRLTTLKTNGYTQDESLTKLLKALISRSPNLRVLNFLGRGHFQENVLVGSSAVLVPAFEIDPIFERLCDSLISAVRAKSVRLLACSRSNFDKELLIKDIPMLLEASQTSLKTLEMDLLFAVLLMCYGICLENVTKLEIWMPSDSLESIPLHILTLLKGFDFTRVFPKLRQVIVLTKELISLTPSQISDFVEQGNAILTKTSLDRAVNITYLAMGEFISHSALPFWAQMLPHITKLLVNTGLRTISQFPFTLLWEKFANIRELIVKTFFGDLTMIANMDSVFCGIFPEEAAELMEKDDKYLKAVNIVPVMPSITCMSDLRTFTLNFKEPQRSSPAPEIKPCPTFLFYKVTALIGFARFPALDVKFESDSYSAKALGHMKNFVSFVNLSPEDRTYCMKPSTFRIYSLIPQE